MIPVQRKRQPKRFKKLVADPGSVFLSSNSSPTSKEYKGHEYWGRISRDLYLAYDRICAYSCHFIPADTGFQSVEHYHSKTAYPAQAYKWNNYRLVCGRLNGRKSDYEDVLDPFQIEHEWFIFDFPSTVVKPGPTLTNACRIKVEATIKRLKLNDDESCIDSRQNWLRAYCKVAVANEQTAFAWLLEYAPFVAKELDRQGLRGAQIISQMNSSLPQ